MSLSDLVRRAQAGDELARVDLVEQATRLVYARVLRALKGQAVAEDVAQEALLEALLALPRLRDPEAFLPWLRRIADRALADHWHAGRRESPVDATVLEAVPSTQDDAGKVLERTAEHERIRAALSALRPRSRLALELFYFHELSSREVAYFLGVSDDAARASLAGARRELRRRVTSMTVAEQPPTKIRYSTTSSPGTFRGPVFAHDSTTARLYLALYPSGDAGAAAESAGLSQEVAARELAHFEAPVGVGAQRSGSVLGVLVAA